MHKRGDCLPILVFIIITVLAPGLLFGRETTASEQPQIYHRFPQAIGAQTGRISGSGLAYHLWMENLGFQAAGGIIYLPDNGSPLTGNELDYSIGVEIQRIIYGQDFANWLSGNLYLFGGLNHFGYIRAPGNDFIPGVGVGFGFGTEIILFQHFSFPVEIGYAGFWEMKAVPLDQQFEVNIIIQGGFRYRFVFTD